MTKYCKNCGKLNENSLLKFCRSCYPIYGKQLAKTKIKPVSDKKKERLASGGSEKQKFRQKLIEAQDNNGYLTCQFCGKKFSIENAGPWCLPHILNKKDYPHLRLMINNIGIVCSIEHHQEFDKIINKIKKDMGNKELETFIASGKDVTNLIDNYK